MKNKNKTCCFIGHREIIHPETVKKNLYSTIEKLITENAVDIFLFGSKSAFNHIAYETVSSLKEKYPQIIRIYVRSHFPDISEEYKKYLLSRYEDTYFPSGIMRAGRASYVERNYEMIDKSSYCVFYYDKNYISFLKENGSVLNSGTKIAYRYALKQKAHIINLFQNRHIGEYGDLPVDN